MNQNKGTLRKTIISALFLALAASYCTFPLILRQNLPYAQDIIFHIFQADQFNRAIHDGVIYPRWVLDSNNGYGSATFIFYSPLSYYLVSIITFLIPSLTAAMIVAIWCGFFSSGVAMFIAVRRLFGESGSLLSAVLYQILPFHLLDLYSRGGFAEIFAFIWFPLIFLWLHETLYSGKTRTASVGLSVSYAGLILTHLVSGFIFSFVIAGYLAYYLFQRENGFLIKTSLSLGLGLGLSSAYLIPVIFERKFVQINAITNCPIGDYRKNFLFTWDKIQSRLADFYVPLHTTVVLEALLFLLILLSVRKLRQSLSGYHQAIFFTILFLVAFFFTTPLSSPLWKVVPGLPMLQFPWRWVPVMEVSLCLLVGYVFSTESITKLQITAIKRRVFYVLIMISLASSVAIFNSKTLPQRFVDKYLVPEKIKTLVDPILEYTPIWARDMRTIMSEEGNKRVSVISGAASTDTIVWRSEQRTILVRSEIPSILRISTFYYPGWNAWMDGGKIQIETERVSGAMLLGVPKGEHTVELKFTDTPLRFFSKIVSEVSLFVAFFLVMISGRRRDAALRKEQ